MGELFLSFAWRGVAWRTANTEGVRSVFFFSLVGVSYIMHPSAWYGV